MIFVFRTIFKIAVLVLLGFASFISALGMVVNNIKINDTVYEAGYLWKLFFLFLLLCFGTVMYVVIKM